MTAQTQTLSKTLTDGDTGAGRHVRQVRQVRQVRRFLAECTVRDLEDTDVLPVADLYGMYIIWCEQTETRHAGIQTFSTLLRAEGIPSGTSRGEKVFKGVIATGAIPVRYILETDKSPGPNSALGTLSV